MYKGFEIIGLTPPGFPGAGLARASRIGIFQGGISAEYTHGPLSPTVLNRVSETGSHWCVCISLHNESLLQSLVAAPPKGLTRVILCDSELESLGTHVNALRCKGLEVFVQVLGIDEARAAQAAGADAIVVKGNEAGGRVGEETTLILLQRVRSQTTLPIWVRGGIGLRTAAACVVGGAAGAVLDWQLALCQESELLEDVKARISRMDGSETAILGQGCPFRYRAFTRAGETGFNNLRDTEETLGLDLCTDKDTLNSWRIEVERGVNAESGSGKVLFIGQDAAFATSLANTYKSAVKIAEAIRHEALRLPELAARQKALRPGGPLAASHGTRYPILQGPMTRVSDVADFADAVAAGGGLPFLALALLRGPQVDKLLEETKQKLGSKPWGVGILGFVPKELRDEQLAEVRKHPPPFAIIAGGRPDQALELEREGIATYLHVPSPGLLSMFLKSGARRVIFEGRECGGHVGPRSSFVLWESMIQTIHEHLEATGDPGRDYHVVFAGGIHDACSAAMVAALSATLVERGVQVGVLIGTAYLFTKEAVQSGAIVQGFQDEAVKCRQTILLESGVGHATRCADTEFGKTFLDEKKRLIREGRTKEEIREALERLNLGRLRIASKAIMRDDSLERENRRGAFVSLDDSGQKREGMYMIGQVAALRDRVCTIEDLHADVSAGGVEHLAQFASPISQVTALRPSGPSDIAIIGMSCLLPKASDKDRYWENILNGVRCTDEVPADRWDSELYFTSDRRARDNCYSKWGGFIDPVPFDPMRYGMPPNSIPSVEPLQLLVLEAVRHALQDAGYADKPFDRENTSVILGAGGGVGEHGLGYGFRSMALHYLTAAGSQVDEVKALLERLDGKIPEWTEDSFAGLLLNVAAGRVANRFDLGGTNYTVDAACASSLAAVRLAVEELESGSSNMVVVGGADTMQSPFAYLCFSNTQALSPTGASRPFDASADGIVISEGIAIAILKRLEDAERDGDRIYAVIKGVGSSSDGKDKGLTAPRPAGQIRALERAYAKAGFSPDTVGLFEAHGTGTVVGDQSEAESLTRALTGAGAKPQSAALGSVKSMLGHTKCTAGVAGLLKAALALHHKVLPPTIGVTQPNPKARFDESPLYVNTESRPWLRNGGPRRAGVSAFGFGGTNFHAVLEEYTPSQTAQEFVGAGSARFNGTPGRLQWPAELLIWRANQVDDILNTLDLLSDALATGSKPQMRDLAGALAREAQQAPSTASVTLAIVVGSHAELATKVGQARGLVAKGQNVIDPGGIYFCAKPMFGDDSVALLFPGQGSQSVNMLRDLAIASPLAREVFERADAALGERLGAPLSHFIFPLPSFTDAQRAVNEKALTQTQVAQPALGAADSAMLHLLGELGVTANFLAGHSYGEYVALYAAGVFSFEALMRISEARGRLIGQAGAKAGGTMAAVSADEATVSDVLSGIDGVWCANFNSPSQTVISGTDVGIGMALERLAARGLSARKINVSCAFHSPLVQEAADSFSKALGDTTFNTPVVPVFSNTTARPHPNDSDAIRIQLVEHLIKPVRFAEQLRAMHDAGARIFVEVGPGRVLSGLVEQTLKGRPFASIVLNSPGRDAITSLMHGLGQLAAAGVRFDSRPLTENRTAIDSNVTTLLEQSRPAEPSRTTWMITGAKAVPLYAPSNGGTSADSKPPTETASPRKPATLPGAQPHSDVSAIRPTTLHSSIGLPLPPSSISHAPQSKPVANATTQFDSLITAHQQLMARFLDTHKNVMLSLLGQNTATATSGGEARPSQVVADRPISIQESRVTQQPASKAPPVVEFDAKHLVQNGTATLPASESPAGSSKEAVVDPRVKLTNALVAIVADRTGYPPEMLGLDMDLEADLGIDSIKRVEILGALQDNAALPGQSAAGDMETLSKVKTLRGIVDWLVDRARSSPSTMPAPTVTLTEKNSRLELAPVSSKTVECEVPRMILQAVDHPLDASPNRPVTGAVVIIDDELGVASAVAEQLRVNGLSVEIAHVVRGAEHNGSHPRINLSDPAVAQSWCGHIREKHGRIGMVLHLLPLAGSSLSQEEPGHWVAPLETELHSLFNVVQAAEADLRQDGGRVLTITRFNGAFGSVGDGGEFWPGSGGVCGLVKTLAREWPETISRVIDVGPLATIDQIVAMTLSEVASADPSGEVGYLQGRRVALLPTGMPLAGSEPTITLTKDSVLLITGGARGITAEAGIELARRYSCRLVLVGRTALPSAQESDATAGVTDSKQLRSILLQTMSASGEKVTPARVESAYAKLMRERETRQNLTEMRAAGSEIEYHAVDVADGTAFGLLIDEIYQRHGRIDGVIHGAGIIEDKLIRDKTLESFRRVCDPKIRGALTLATKIRPDSLSFMVFFSSVSGRYGNRGQADYAAANEVLDKLAIYLNARWKARVAALIWGPWESTGGMVSDELARQFAKAGIHIISRAQGRVALANEIIQGRKDEAEVVFGGPLNISLPGHSEFSPQTESPILPGDLTPILKTHTTATRRPDGTLVVIRDVDPATDIYLSDHQLDGRPVMPMAMIQELFAEVAQLSRPELHVTAVRDLRVLRGMSFEKGSRQIRVIANPWNGTDGSVKVRLKADFGEQHQIHDTAEIELNAQFPAPPKYAPLQLINARPLPMSVADAYEQWLFHGPIFAGIVDVESLGENGVIAQLAPSTPMRCLAQSPTGDWLIDPVMVDSALQLIILWARVYIDMTPLPARLACYHRFAGPIRHPVRCEATVQHTRGTPVILADFRFIDASGRLVGWLEGLEGTCSKALNRLAETRGQQMVEQK